MDQITDPEDREFSIRVFAMADHLTGTDADLLPFLDVAERYRSPPEKDSQTRSALQASDYAMRSLAFLAHAWALRGPYEGYAPRCAAAAVECAHDADPTVRLEAASLLMCLKTRHGGVAISDEAEVALSALQSNAWIAHELGQQIAFLDDAVAKQGPR